MNTAYMRRRLIFTTCFIRTCVASAPGVRRRLLFRPACKSVLALNSPPSTGHEQGNLSSTDNTLDIAIQGDGFFAVTLPSGDRLYPRRSLQRNQNGEIDHDWYPLADGITTRRTPSRFDQRFRFGGAKIENPALTQVGKLARDLPKRGLDHWRQPVHRNPLLRRGDDGQRRGGRLQRVLQGFLETSNERGGEIST